MQDQSCPLISPDATAKELRVQRGIVNFLRSKFQRLLPSLLFGYRESTLRLVLSEIRSFPLRILAVRQSPTLRYGPTILAANWDSCTWSVHLENKYGRACMSRIQELQKDHHWLTSLDMEIAARMYRWGALWALDNMASCTETHSTEQIEPLEIPES
jgi:hypothetical protein